MTAPSAFRNRRILAAGLIRLARPSSHLSAGCGDSSLDWADTQGGHANAL
jgi:hypothetical protein